MKEVYVEEARLGGGAFAEVLVVEGGAAVLKVARASRAFVGGVTRAIHLRTARAFHTGTVSDAPVDCDAVVRAEGEVLAEITHPAFVRLLDRGRTQRGGASRAALLLERIEGETLRGKRFAPDAARAVLAQVIGAIDGAIAGAPFLHGDLKPENLLLERSGAIRILDPSATAWAALEGRTPLGGDSAEGTVGRVVRAGGSFGGSASLGLDVRLFTPTYNPFGARSDVPSLGLLNFDLLTGEALLGDLRRAPLVVAPEPHPSWLAGGGLARVRLPSEVAPSLPPFVERVVLRSLGLAWDGGVLAFVAPYPSPRALLDDIP